MLPPSRPMACVLSTPTKPCSCPFNDPKAERETLGSSQLVSADSFPDYAFPLTFGPVVLNAAQLLAFWAYIPKQRIRLHVQIPCVMRLPYLEKQTTRYKQHTQKVICETHTRTIIVYTKDWSTKTQTLHYRQEYRLPLN
jgi:hypothetical protein